MQGRILGVDPGEKRIGVAISDESGKFARGLGVIKHVSMKMDCVEIMRVSSDYKIMKIIVGNPINESDEERPQNRHAKKMAENLAEISGLPVILWDETGSTQLARSIKLEAGGKRAQRRGHLDEVAAALILQSWLDSRKQEDNADA